MTIIGIDNGLSGGLCAVDHDTEEVLGHTAMPTYQEGSKTEVFVAGVLDFIYKYNADKILVAIEEPLKHAKSSQAVRSMAISFGKCVGACDAIRVPVCRIQVKDWQDAVLGKGLAKGNTKVKALAVASKRWPEQDWLATRRSKVPHDGIIDAALIAYFVAKSSSTILP